MAYGVSKAFWLVGDPWFVNDPINHLHYRLDIWWFHFGIESDPLANRDDDDVFGQASNWFVSARRPSSMCAADQEQSDPDSQGLL